MIDIKDYYLDINLIFNLDKDKSSRIFDMYDNLLSSFREGQIGTTQAYFNTLIKSGYLKNKTTEERTEKIDIING